jgi:hypothetical protein
MGLSGKGFFIWKVPSCENGNPAYIAARAVESKFTHVLIKIADGIALSNYDTLKKIDYIAPVVTALRAKGIQVWGWHYVYGDDPLQEARLAAQRVTASKLDGYVIDAEIQYKQPGKSTAAKSFMTELRKYLPNTLVALSTYRYPSYHMEFPFNSFLEKCNYAMPQVYFEQAHNPDEQLLRCIQEYRTLVTPRTIIPTGPTYKAGSWGPTEKDITLFMKTAVRQNLPGVNFFSWDECRRDLSAVWNTIGSFAWGSTPVLDFPDQFLAALNSRNPDTVAAMYGTTAVQITPARTIQGSAAIRSWYEGLFNQILPNAVFTLTGSSGTGSTRHINWNCTSTRGTIQNGSDTFGLVSDKISYHYSFYKLP